MARDGTGVKAISKTSYQISFVYKGILCRERIKRPVNKDNQKKLELFRAQIVQAIEDGYFDYAVTFPQSKKGKVFAEQEKNAKPLLKDYLIVWLNKKRPELHTSSINGYEKIIQGQIIPNLGDIPLECLTRHDVREWISKKSGVANKTINNILSPLRTALDDAVQEGLIETNILYGFSYKNPRNKTSRKPKLRLDPYSKAEQDAILGVLQGQAYNLVKFWFWTGLRTSELVALEWDDVDLMHYTININKALTDTADEAEDTKTINGERLLKLLPPAIEALTAQIAFTYAAGKQVFYHHKQNKPWTGAQQIRRTLWEPALKAAKVRYRKPYHVRHTFASMMISSGENVHWLSKYLGHADAVTTQRFYAVWLRDANDNAGMKAVEKYS